MNVRELKKQAFWIGLGVAGIVLIVLVVMMVMPRSTKIENLSKSIRRLSTELRLAKDRGDVPGNPDVAKWGAEKKKLKGYLDETVGFFEKEDVKFEQWFEDLGVTPEGTPNGGDFLVSHLGRQGLIDESLAWSREHDSTKDRGYIHPTIEWLNGRTNALAAMKDMQKMFWIRKRFADSLEPMLAKERSLPEEQRRTVVTQLAWMRDLYQRHGRPTGDRGYRGADDWRQQKYPGVPVRGPQGYVLPEKMGRCFVFMAKFEIMLSDMPVFLRSFLSFSGQEPSMFIDLMGLRVMPFEDAEYLKRVPVRKQDTPAQQQATLDKERDKLIPNPVRVWIAVRIMDPDVAAIRTFHEGAMKPPKKGP
jgi:hypothetical protein